MWQASQSRRESLDFGSGLPPMSAGREWGGASLMSVSQPSTGGGGPLRQPLQQQRLLRMASGECEPIPEPSDWDPLYRYISQPGQIPKLQFIIHLLQRFPDSYEHQSVLILMKQHVG